MKVAQIRNNGRCLSFDGKDDKVTIPYNTSLDLDYITIEAWIYMTTYTQAQAASHHIILNKESSYELGVKADTGELQAAIKPNWSWYGTMQVPLNEWVHVAVTWDGTYLKLYVNGQEEIITPVSTGVITDTTNGLGIGARGIATDGTGGNSFFTGKMRDVRLWNYARTKQEIINSIQGIGGNESGLVGCWLLHEGSGTIANDISANVNNATIYGATWVDEGQQLNLLLASEIVEGSPANTLTISPNGTTNLIPSTDLSNLHAWNSTDGHNSYAVQQPDGFWRVNKVNSATGRTNTEILMNKTYTIIEGQTYTESFYFKHDGTTIAFDITFFTANGHHAVPTTIENLGNGLCRAYASYTTVTGDSWIRAIDFTSFSGDWTYIDIAYAQLELGALTPWIEGTRQANSIITQEFIEEDRPAQDITENLGMSGNLEDCTISKLYGDPNLPNSTNLITVGNGWKASMHYSPADEYCEVVDVQNAIDGPRVFRIYDNGSGTWKAFSNSSYFISCKSTKWYRISVYARVVQGQGTKYADAYLPYFGDADNQKVTWTANELASGEWVRKYTIFQPSADKNGSIYLYGHYGGAGIVEYDGIMIEEFDAQPTGEPPKLNGVFLDSNNTIIIRGGELVEGVNF